jgi:hypothetical protein
MDQSAPAIYYKQGYDNGINKTLITLGGGGLMVK